MTARVLRTGRFLFPLLATAALGGCVMEYNPDRVAHESDVLVDAVQLTSPAGAEGFDRAGEARLSPDGRWVVFRGLPHDPARNIFADPGYGLFVARVRWSGDRGSPDRHVVGLDRAVRVTRVGDRAGTACFSPDGFSLAFAVAVVPAGTPPQVAPSRLYRADNWEQAVAMTDTARGVDLAQHPITPPDLSVSQCDWSPDGRTICVAARGAGGGQTELYALPADASRPILLNAARGGFAHDPAVSPDGRRLAYCGADGTSGTPDGPQVWSAAIVFDTGGDAVGLTDRRALTHEPVETTSGCCWLPDGNHLVYATNRDAKLASELYVMDAEGKRKTRLTLGATRPGPPESGGPRVPNLLPSLSRDGRTLLWTSARTPDESPQVFAAGLRMPSGS